MRTDRHIGLPVMKQRMRKKVTDMKRKGCHPGNVACSQELDYCRDVCLAARHIRVVLATIHCVVLDFFFHLVTCTLH